MNVEAAGDLRDTKTAARFYDERFQRGYMGEWGQEKCDRIAQLLTEFRLPPIGRALDFGCGTGVFTRVLSKALPGWEVVGTDLSAIAVETAARRLPHCRFFPLAECSRHERQFDLVFSHHVLEHVSDLNETARLLDRLARPSASMFHILPCGNAGSFEHQVCLLRKDGIRSQPERLFFFEEEGHLRRLDTDSLVALWARDGYRLERAWYANQRIGALATRTSFGLSDVLAFADPDEGVDASARRKLRRLRAGMAAMWALRKPVAVVRNKRIHGCHTVRDVVLLLGGLAAYPLAGSVEWLATSLASREWQTRRYDRAGSEMYIHLVRS